MIVKEKSNKILFRISIFALLLMTAFTLIFTYAWFVDSENATGTITFGVVDIEAAYANWTGINLLAGDQLFNDPDNPATDLKVKLANNSQPVYLVIAPLITWTVEIPQSATDDGVTLEEVNAAVAVLKSEIENNFSGFGVAGTHNFGATAPVTLDETTTTAYIYTGAGTEPAAFTSITEVTALSVADAKVSESADQAIVIGDSGKSHLTQDWCTFNLVLKIFAVQQRNVSPTVEAICNAVGMTVLP